MIAGAQLPMLICIILHWLLWLPECAASHCDLFSKRRCTDFPLDVHLYYTKTGQHHQTNEGAQRCTYALNWLPTRLTDHQQRSHAAAVAISWTALWMLCKFPSDHDCFQSKLNYLHSKKMENWLTTIALQRFQHYFPLASNLFLVL